MKDWKGNKNSAHAAIAAHNGKGKSDRQEDDFYATDPKAITLLLKGYSEWMLDKLRFSKSVETGKLSDYIPTPIWECACGSGNLSHELIKNGYFVWATDLKDRGYGMHRNIDFLTTKQCGMNIILTNPPYSLATEFIEHALEILPDGGLYIALMNITYLAGQKRYERVYSKGSLREVYIFSKRIECWKNGERPKDKCGSIANYAWYVFQKGYNGQPTLYWL